MERGWIKLWRKSTDSQVFQSEGLWKLWTWCLMKANHTEAWVPINTGKGDTSVQLKPGQFVFGRHTAARELGMNPSTVRDRMHKLESMSNITLKADTHFTVVTIRNWHQYQVEAEHKPTTKRQANDTNKNEKNKKKSYVKQKSTHKGNQNQVPAEAHMSKAYQPFEKESWQ
jgi:hypothetical protein